MKTEYIGRMLGSNKSIPYTIEVNENTDQETVILSKEDFSHLLGAYNSLVDSQRSVRNYTVEWGRPIYATASNVASAMEYTHTAHRYIESPSEQMRRIGEAISEGFSIGTLDAIRNDE